MGITINGNLKIRRDTQSNWVSYNPVLLEGEIGFETDTRKIKVGNGTSNWNDLDYIYYGSGGGGSDVTLYPHLTVISPVGCTVTAKKGDSTVTLTDSNNSGSYGGELTSFGTWTVTCTYKDRSNSKTIDVSEVKVYTMQLSYGYRYGYRIKISESNPSSRVEYLFDAVGMNPAKMNFTTGVFDYGDWADKWFVKENKPCMLKNDGTVDYYLNPNNYSLREDGTASDVANTSYAGNAMAQIPLCYVKRYEENGYQYEIVSDVKYDDDYKAYAHTRADGTIADYFYWSMFGGSGSASKIRSLSGQSLARNLDASGEIAGAKANGAKWYTHSWSQHELIRTLLVLMGKSTDTQSVFGYGNCHSSSESGLLATGTLKDKGQFYGYSNSTHQVKVFHIEKFWGDQWDRVAGLINNGGKIHVKMTPEGSGYRVNDVSGYTNTGLTPSGTNGGYISTTKCSENGNIPYVFSGSSSTYYCDGAWYNNSGLMYLLVGAGAYNASSFGGAFTFRVDFAPSSADWNSGCGLSCEQPA